MKENQPGTFRSLVWACALSLCLPLFASIQAKAQTLYGSVVGTVTDNTGAAVPEANVVVTETQTNDMRTVVTDNGGVYTVSTVPPGNYQVVITKQGFEGYKTKGIDVTANNVVRVDAQLQVGTVSQTVEVQSAVAAQLQTDTGRRAYRDFVARAGNRAPGHQKLPGNSQPGSWHGASRRPAFRRHQQPFQVHAVCRQRNRLSRVRMCALKVSVPPIRGFSNTPASCPRWNQFKASTW